MRGKRAREIRRAARGILGPDAPMAEYDGVQQRGSAGGATAPQPYVDAAGKPVMVRVRGEYFDLGRWLWRPCTITTGVPIFKTTGQELRLTAGCLKGLARRIKSKYV